MRKRGMIACLVVLLGLLLLGCTQAPSGSAAKAEPVTKYVCSDGKTTVDDIASCPPSAVTAKELTEEEKSLAVCAGMPSFQGGSLEDSCIMGVAGKYKNTSLCIEVSRDQRLNCYTLIAELKNDPAICAEAESMAGQCYMQYAANKKDSSVCTKITEVGSRDSCYDRLANELADASLCDKILNVNQKDGCYFNMAMRFGDSSYCDSIKNGNQKESCLMNLQNRGGGVSIPQKY